MPGNGWRLEEPGDELRDDEFPDEDDSDDELTLVVPCPQCGADVYEDAMRCPACEAYITHQSNLWAGRPGWWIILGLLGILAVILVLAGYSAR